VRNVAMPLLKRPYALYCLDADGGRDVDGAARGACAPETATGNWR
jgi:hypothetical protein